MTLYRTIVAHQWYERATQAERDLAACRDALQDADALLHAFVTADDFDEFSSPAMRARMRGVAGNIRAALDVSADGSPEFFEGTLADGLDDGEETT
jgi:hypothetical protein